MKIIVAGATGFVGTEVIRQSLRRPDIKSVIALSRKQISEPWQLKDGEDSTKLRRVVIKDYGDYPDAVRKEFADADACIWTVAITPSKSKSVSFEEVRRVCQHCALAGVKAMHEAAVRRPFRFLYMSGVAAERDQTKTPPYFAEYSLMRGEAENRLLAFAAEFEGDIELCVAKPGWITSSSFSTRSIMAFALKWTASLPSVTVSECSAAMLDQVTNGFDKEPLMSEDLTKIGRQALEKYGE